MTAILNHNTLTALRTSAAAVCVRDSGTAVAADFWWFGYGYFSQEPSCL